MLPSNLSHNLSHDTLKNTYNITRHKPVSSFLDYRPTPGVVSSQQDTAVILGDLHACVPSLISRLVEANCIRPLSEENYAIFMQANASTLIEQLEETALEFDALESYQETGVNPPAGILGGMITKDTLAVIMDEKCRFFNLLEEKIQNDLRLFRAAVVALQVIDMEKLVILLGDELADRNGCDLFMLILIADLIKKNLKLKFILSNHGLEFLLAVLLDRFSMNDPVFFMQADRVDCFRSLQHLKLFIHYDFVTKAEVQSLATVWMENLHLVLHTVNDKSITTYSHAPVGEETYRRFARLFGLPFNKNSVAELSDTLIAIDNAFRIALTLPSEDPKSFLFPFNVPKSSSSMSSRGIMDQQINAFSTTPYYRITWNTQYHDIEPIRINGSEWRGVHGHHMPQPGQSVPQQLSSLDNHWGRPVFVKIRYSFDDVSFSPYSGGNKISLCYLNDEKTLLSYIGKSNVGRFVPLGGSGVSGDKILMPERYFQGAFLIKAGASMPEIQAQLTHKIHAYFNASLHDPKVCPYESEIVVMTARDRFPAFQVASLPAESVVSDSSGQQSAAAKDPSPVKRSPLVEKNHVTFFSSANVMGASKRKLDDLCEAENSHEDPCFFADLPQVS